MGKIWKQSRKYIYWIPLLTVLFVNPSVVGAYVPQTTKEKQIEKAGNILQLLILTGGYAATFIVDDKEGRVQFYKSFFTNLGITYALKYSISKPRPENNGVHSFPSGHTSAAFQGATFILKRYGWEFGIPAYIGAAFVGFSRDEGDKHDFVDIPVGAAIGILSSYYFTTPYKSTEISPVVDRGFYGIIINTKF